MGQKKKRQQARESGGRARVEGHLHEEGHLITKLCLEKDCKEDDDTEMRMTKT